MEKEGKIAEKGAELGLPLRNTKNKNKNVKGEDKRKKGRGREDGYKE